MSFDDPIDRRGTHCYKWDMMQASYGVSPDDGIAMWVADMEFRPPEVVQKAVENMTALDRRDLAGGEGSDGEQSAPVDRTWLHPCLRRDVRQRLAHNPRLPSLSRASQTAPRRVP